MRCSRRGSPARLLATGAAVLVAAGTLLVMAAGPSLAFGGRLGQTYVQGATIRLYDRPDLATAGYDGHCVRGRDNPRDWACHADGTNDRRRFSATAPARDHRLWVAGRGRYMTVSNAPSYSGHVPYCMPDWYRFGVAYHNDQWAGMNHYYCGFWK